MCGDIGRQFAQKLTRASIDSAADLARVSNVWARKHLGGVVGARLVRELQGFSCAGLHPSEDGSLSWHSLICSHTFGRPLTAFADLLGAVTAFLARAAEKLRAQGDKAHVLTVCVQKNRFDPLIPPPHTRSVMLTRLSGPTADTLLLSHHAQHLLTRLWEPGTAYHKAGVVLNGLEPSSRGKQLGLFASVAVPTTSHPELMTALDLLNGCFGRGTVRVASAVSAGQSPPWQGMAQWRSGPSPPGWKTC